MNSTPQIFKDRLIQNYLSKFSENDIPDFGKKWNQIRKWRESCVRGDLGRTKETQIQGSFMVQIFDQVLGYSTLTSADSDRYYQRQESRSGLDSSEADAGLGFFSEKQGTHDVRAVVELKDAKTDLDKKQNRSNHLTPVEQAFNYANKNGSKCAWVIVSNFVETRLYRSTSSLEYETFDIRKMDEKTEFLRFCFFLCKEHLLDENGKSLIEQLYQENEELGTEISKEFYQTYHTLRSNLYAELKRQNTQTDALLLFTKSQKIMDRFIFICFSENCGLLPRGIFQRLIETAHNSFSVSPTRLWDEFRGLCAAIDQGRPPMKINRYNGGLFRADPELDNLTVGDAVLESFAALAAYDFGSDLNVNILGQIFEQSISDVEQMKAEEKAGQEGKAGRKKRAGQETGSAASRGKRKADGIFYTPYYVTRYIVGQTVGAYLTKKKEMLKRDLFQDGPYKVEIIREKTGRRNTFTFTHWVEIPDGREDMADEEWMRREAVIKMHLDYWTRYEDILKNIKICDPACGSGAFLNQCFDYLHEEMNFTLDMKRDLSEEQFNLFDIDKEILQNNLFGVDINPESVEITRLSLWLKTAKPNQTLASLDDNIKCGNSIVSDPAVAGELAFDWQTEFASVFSRGGFDIVIGNPPYGASVSQAVKEYLTAHYQTTEYNFDTYKTFYELGFRILKERGYLGYITPNTFFTLERGANRLRKFLYDRHTLLRIVEVYNVFPAAVVEPVITVFQKREPSRHEPFLSVCLPRDKKLTSTFLNEGVEITFTQEDLKKNSDYIFNYRSSKREQDICLEMQKYDRLDTLFDVMTGAKPYQVGKGTPPQTKEIVDSKPYTSFEKKDDSWVPYMRGRSIERYTNAWAASKEYIRYGVWLAEPRLEDVFRGEKVFVRQTGDSLIATYDIGNISNNTLHSIFPIDSNHSVSLYYLLGILNSTLMNWYYKIAYYLEVGKPMAEVKAAYIKRLPIALGLPEQTAQIEGYAKKLLSVCQDRFEKGEAFLRYILQAYEPKKLSETMRRFDELSFKDFLTELQRQRAKLSASQQMELLSLYEQKRRERTDANVQIAAAQRALDDLVFRVYQISDDTAALIREETESKL